MIAADQRPHTILQFIRVLREQRGIDRTYSTVKRWIETGSKVGDVYIKLDASAPGGAYHVTLEQYDRFVEETTQARMESA